MPNPGPGNPMPAEYWESILGDPLADASTKPPGPSVRTLRLFEIS